jgi:iron complex transport system ATP-binding protein
MSLVIERLSVQYGQVPVLSDISFSLAQGEVLCIIGPNGSGKSTLIKTIAGILDPHSGSISLDGTDLKKISRNEVAKKIGYVPQDFQVLVSTTVLETIILGRRPHVQWSLTHYDLERIEAAMEMLNITLMSEKMLTQLSGGERQRVFIARTIAQEPEIFLFDEPTSALDIRHQIEVFTMVRHISENQKRSVLVAVHDLNFAYHYADRVMLINKGRIVGIGTADEVMTGENIISVYGVPMQFITTDAGRYILPIWDRASSDHQHKVVPCESLAGTP